MIDSQKEQERQELHQKIWQIADNLRGAVDGWDFKSYVLVAMLYRFLSENITDAINDLQHKAGDLSFNYAELSDDQVTGEIRKYIIDSKGYFVAPSQLFANVLIEAKSNAALYSKESTGFGGRNLFNNGAGERVYLNKKLAEIFKEIERSASNTESEDDFKGLFSDFDVNSPKLGNDLEKREERLLAVLEGVASMKLRHSNNTIDAFGDAYEYLMAMYASSAGKSGGEFFTPQEVSELLAKIATAGQDKINKAYDPACGSGSLLLKVKSEAEKTLTSGVVGGFFGQEINLMTFNMCRINMILHGVPYNRFNIENGDTLLEPKHWDDEPFDVIVSNPPYSIKWKGDDDVTLINDVRFSPAGVLAPKSKADLAFVMHSLAWLSEKGTAAIVCFPGVLYRGGAEQKIRKYMVTNNRVDAVIQLPSNLFYGTSIATCILVLKKNKLNDSILFVDASREFVKVTNNNKLTPKNISRIADSVVSRADVDHFARLVPFDEVVENDYNLSVSTYVEQPDTREKIDIVKLNAEIKEIVAREQVLRDAIDKIIAEIEGSATA